MSMNFYSTSHHLLINVPQVATSYVSEEGGTIPYL